jgi:acylphosphatase
MTDTTAGGSGHDVPKQQLRAVVRGRVQGVGYRYFVQRAAVSLELIGYVRNLGDGTVEVLASGDKESLCQLVEKLWEGPPSSRVDGVAKEWAPGTSRSRSFQIRF